VAAFVCGRGDLRTSACYSSFLYAVTSLLCNTLLFTVGHAAGRSWGSVNPLDAAAGRRSLRRIVNEACATSSERERLRHKNPAQHSGFHPPPDGPCFAPQCRKKPLPVVRVETPPSRLLQRDFSAPFAQTHSLSSLCRAVARGRFFAKSVGLGRVTGSFFGGFSKTHSPVTAPRFFFHD
jgi:hypothetical protein